MKKLITGAIAAAALLFGFASCTGPLHDNIYDNEVQPLTIVGLTRDAGNHCVAMTLDKPDGSEQSLKFKLSEDFELTAVDGKKYKIGGTGSWGNGSPNQFKIIPSANVKADGTPDWKVDYGWETDTGMLYIKPGADYHALLKRGDAGTTAAGPSNVAIDGAIANEEYTIKVKYDAASQSVSVKVEGNSSDPSAMIINLADNSKNFPATDKDGKEIATDKTVDTANGDTYAKVTMEKAGTTYTYQFISKENETLKFTLKNDLAGTFGIVGDIATGTYKVGNDDVYYTTDLTLNDDTSSDLSLAVKKDYEYKLVVDTSKGANKATVRYEIVSLLKNTAIYANWKYAENFYEVAANTSGQTTIWFSATRPTLDFVVNRVAGSGDKVWGTTPATIAVDASATSLTYTLYEDTTTNKAATKATEKVTAGSKPDKTVTVTGLTVGKGYFFVLSSEDSDFVLKIAVETAPLVNLASPLLGINGDMNSWDHTDFTITGTGENQVGVVEFTATAIEHRVQIAADGWNPQYGNGKEIAVDGDELTAIFGKSDMIISGCVVGKTYQVICKPNYGTVDVKVVTKN